MVYSLYNQIQRQDDLKTMVHELLYVWDSNRIMYLCVVMVLMAVNWTLEAVKWRMLLKNTERFTLWESLQSVLTGVAVSMITPNRIGEYMGRILYLKNVHKLQGITVTIVGSFAQLMITAYLGLVGLVYYLTYVLQNTWLYILLIASVGLCIVLTWLYFHLGKVADKLEGISLFKKIRIYIDVVKRFGKNQLNWILIYSLLRYVVYSLQFFILLRLMLVDVSMPAVLFTIWLIFWAMAIVPTIAIAELGIRGETALYFLSPLCINSLGVVSSTVLLWIINLIIPALIGCLFVFKIKIYDDD